MRGASFNEVFPVGITFFGVFELFCQQTAQLLNALGILRIVDGVMGFIRVFVEIEILILSTLIEPNEFIVLCDNKLAGIVVEEECVLAVQIGAFYAAQHTFTVQMFRDGCARQVEQGRHHVAQFYQRIIRYADFAEVFFTARQKHGNMRAAAVRQGLAAEAVVGKHLAVVGRKQDNGIIHELMLNQSLNHASDLVVNMRNASIVTHLLLTNQLGVRRAGAGVKDAALFLQKRFVVPIAAHRRTQVFVFVQIKIMLRCIVRRMRTHKAGHQEKRLTRVAAAQKVDGAGCHPVGGMIFLLIRPRACRPTVAVHAGIRHVTLNALFVFQPVEIVVGDELVFGIGHVGITILMQITVVQLYMVKAQIIAQRMHMHFSDTFGVIARFGQFSGHGAAIVPIDTILIAHLSRVTLA